MTVKTAEQWKAGVRKPSRQALRLFSLYRDARVLGPEWRGWKVSKYVLTDPDGNSTTAAQIFGYALILQWVAAVAARPPDSQRQYLQLLKRA